MANAIVKYTIGSSFIIKIFHLEGQKVFGSTKRRVDIALGSQGDSHRHDHVNFSRLKVNAMSSGFLGLNVDVSESNGIVQDYAFVLTFHILKVQEHVCKNGVRRIEKYPPLSNIC
jgi:hypothetical protein